MQLRNRLEGIDRIHREADALEDKIKELEEKKSLISGQLMNLNLLRDRITVNLMTGNVSVELAA